jgi:hypothetical protein
VGDGLGSHRLPGLPQRAYVHRPLNDCALKLVVQVADIGAALDLPRGELRRSGARRLHAAPGYRPGPACVERPFSGLAPTARGPIDPRKRRWSAVVMVRDESAFEGWRGPDLLPYLPLGDGYAETVHTRPAGSGMADPSA